MKTKEQKAKHAEYMRAYLKEKSKDPEWVARYNARRRAEYERTKNDERYRRARTEATKRWQRTNKGVEWQRAYSRRPDVRERQRLLAIERRKDPAFRARLNAKKREYSKTPQYVERRRIWARKYRLTESGSRAEMRGRLRAYGITLADYERMFAEQGGVCGICKKFRVSKSHPRLNVDHDHKTGRVRGLLCWMCNRGIGLLGDSRERILSAAEYLK